MEAIQQFLIPLEKARTPSVLTYEVFMSGEYEAIINCVGIADPRKQKADPYECFSVTEHFDNLALDYIKNHEGCRYINFSSGAVFGTEFHEPVGENSSAKFLPNSLGTADYYRIAKLNAEVKHRCLSDLAIVDIRVFSFFSRYIDVEAGFLLSEVACCLRDGRPFRTVSSDMFRDYVSPRDLFSLVTLILLEKPLNTVVDAYSAKPAKKSELLDLFSSCYGLIVETVEENTVTVSGLKSVYYSLNRNAYNLYAFIPDDTSVACVNSEMNELISI